MKLVDIIKNALFEEEYVEVPEKPKEKKKDKPIVQKIVLPDEKKEEAVFEEDEKNDQKEGHKEFKFPVILEDDFIGVKKEEPKKEDIPKKPIKEEVKIEPKIEPTPVYTYQPEKKEPTLYGGKEKEIKISSYGMNSKKQEKKVFHPSPIISPIYGVIDESKTKEETVVKKEVRITSSYASRKIDVDSVRAKAYGNNDDIFEEELSSSEKTKKDEKKNSIIEEDSDVLLDITETRPTVPKVTVGDAEEYFEDLGLEYNIDYKDASQERRTGRRSSLNREEVIEDESNKTDLEDNLFDLIDSMYEEKKGE